MKIGASIPRGGEINSKIHEAPNHREIQKMRKLCSFKNSTEKYKEIPGHWLHVDMSGKLTLSAGGLKYWLLVADEATDIKFSFFMNKNWTQKKNWFHS